MEKGVGVGGGAKPTRSQRRLETSIKMESFPSYGSRIFFTIFEGVLFFNTPLEPFFFFFLAYQEPNFFFFR